MYLYSQPVPLTHLFCVLPCPVQEQKQQCLEKLILTEQATPNILPDGHLKDPVDVQQFLQNVPFHLLYDEAIDK